MRMAVAAGALAWMIAGTGLAKGLDKLSDENPDDQADAPTKGDGDEPKATKTAAPSAASKAIANKLFLGASGGWVKASRADGSWTASGMSDLTIGYVVAPLSKQMGIAATYRYAPIAVSGTLDSRSYRGVWEAHYFGGRLNYQVSPLINAIGSAELGYVMVHVNDADGLQPESKASNPGVSVAVGGGADFMLIDKWTIGPRLNVGFGSFTTFQLAAASGFLF